MIPSQLAEELEAVGRERKLDYKCVEDGELIYAVFVGYAIPSDRYDVRTTDLAVCNTVAYPKTAFDMFYTPGSTRLAGGAAPRGTATWSLPPALFEFYSRNVAGARGAPRAGPYSTWLQWSIHPYQEIPWDPAKDDLGTFMAYVDKRFMNGD